MSTKYIASNWRLPNEENSNKSDNYGLSFSGTSEYINCGGQSLFNGFTAFSVSCWIKRNGTQQAYASILTYQTTTSKYLKLFVSATGSSDRIELSIRPGTVNPVRVVSSAGSIPDGEWVHIAVVGDSNNLSNLNMYINGVLDNDITLGNFTTLEQSSDIYIGTDAGAATTREFEGDISEVAIFDYALSSTQVSTLYGSSSLGAGNPMALKPAPVAFYPLGDNSSGNPLTQPNEAVEDASVFKFDDAPSNNFIDLGLINAIENSTSFTLSFWINPSSFTTPFTLLGNKTGFSGDSAKGIAFDVRSTFLIVYLSDGFTDYARVNNPLSLNEWTLLSVVYDGSGSTNADRLKIYYGSTQQTVNTFGGTIPSTSPTTGRSLILGKQATGQCIEASISNFTIFSNALPTTGTESIETLYNNGVPLNSITSENLKAWYKLDQSANWDLSGSGYWQIPDAVSAYPQSFDFVPNDDINCGTNSIFDITENITLSGWINRDVNTNTDVIISKWASGSNTAYLLRVKTTGGAAGNSKIEMLIRNTSGTLVTAAEDVGEVCINKWAHIMGTYNGSTIRLFYNGVELGSGTAQTGNIQTSTAPLRIGSRGSEYTDGKMSNVAIWNSDQSSEISNIYNSGVPAISYTNTPSAWYKLDNTATFSTNWSVPDASGNGNTGTSSGMTEQNLVNNNVSALNGTSSGMTSANLVLSDLTRNLPFDSYSFNFDSGSNDSITLTEINLGSQQTISLWINRVANGVAGVLLGGSNGWSSTGIAIYVESNNFLYFQVNGINAGSKNFGNVFGTRPAGNWYHICLSRDGNSTTLYVDGVFERTVTGFGTGDLKIDRIASGATAYHFDGKMSNISLFNQALTSTEVMKLYSNGMPQDLSTFTPTPIHWWTLGSNSFFNGSDFICKDLIGSNDGTSVNAGVDALQGNTPRSEANGTGSNMDIPTNLKGTTKYSSNNSWSINMSESARVADTP